MSRLPLLLLWAPLWAQGTASASTGTTIGSTPRAPTRSHTLPPAALRLRGGSLDHSLPAAARRLFAPLGSPHGAARAVLIATPGLPIPRLAHHVRGVVFGGMDGILTTFAVLAAVIGSRQSSTELTLVIGFSTLIADALSMAAGEYLSAKAEDEMELAAVAERGRGLILRRRNDEPGPLEKGFAMFLAFTVFGAMPLRGFIAAAVISTQTGIATDSRIFRSLSVSITALTLFSLGTIKSTFGVGTWYSSGLEVTAIGGAAATVAYYTAKVVDHLVSG